jgi:hypothetical protein
MPPALLPGHFGFLSDFLKIMSFKDFKNSFPNQALDVSGKKTIILI